MELNKETKPQVASKTPTMSLEPVDPVDPRAHKAMDPNPLRGWCIECRMGWDGSHRICKCHVKG